MMLRAVSELMEYDQNEAKVRTSKIEPVFIDRNGDRFDYVLDYMRNGSVTLPITISKDSFLSDLDYYNIGSPQENVLRVKEHIFGGIVCGLRQHDDKLE